MQLVVFYGRTLEDALSDVLIDTADLAALRIIANTELDHLEPYNCARYILARGMTQRWIDTGRTRSIVVIVAPLPSAGQPMGC